MDRPSGKRLFYVLIGLLLVAVFMLSLTGCGRRTTITPTLNQPLTSSPTPSVTPQHTGTPPASLTPGEGNTSTPTSEATPASPDSPLLTLLSPQEGAGIEVGVVRVMGITRLDASVAVNGVTVDVAADGTFNRDVLLESGTNLIRFTATDSSGQSQTQNVEVFFVSSVAALPLSLFYPPDGLVVSDPFVTVVGGTREDAVVGINGIPADINALGVFSDTISLEEGGNLIEVVATDIEENVRFQTVVVFYEP